MIEKGKEEIARQIFSKWDLNCAEIGHVTNDRNVKVYYRGEIEADVPADTLVLGEGAPVYERESKTPEYLDELRRFDFDSLEEPKDYNEVLLKLLSSPNITNKTWVYEQYDTQVRTNTVVLPGGDASVMRIKGTNKALSVKTDCNGRYVYLNPYKGGMIAVCESARNVVCTGAEPLAITNCLNFGNPYKPEVYYQFKEAVRGIGDACRVLNTPVTGGNVSFYNESPDYAVYPTPVIGMVGLIENVDNVMTSYFKDDGDVIALVGLVNSPPLTKGGIERGSLSPVFDGLGGSEYLKVIHNKVAGDAPDIDPEFEKKLHTAILELIRNKLIKSAHDIFDGGLAVALAESCIMNKQKMIGCDTGIASSQGSSQIKGGKNRKDFELFNESQSRIIVSFGTESEETVQNICSKFGVGFFKLGVTGGNSVKIGDEIKISLEQAAFNYYGTLYSIMEK